MNYPEEFKDPKAKPQKKVKKQKKNLKKVEEEDPNKPVFKGADKIYN